MKKLISMVAFVMVFFVTGFASGDKNSEWRGSGRKGFFEETGLLKHWPESGPAMIWSFEGLGAGHSSPCIVGDKLYINGMPDTTGVLFCFDLNGKLNWKKEYGEEWHVNYTGTRSTPAYSDGNLYILSGMGELFCFEAENGELVWSVNVLEKFGGTNIQWGITENLLIDGDWLICTPGGEKHNIIALNKKTGELIWTSSAFGEQSAYCSPLLFTHNNKKLIATMTATSVVCVDAENGAFLWRAKQFQTNKIHANTPVYEKGILYCSSTSSRERNSGLLALQLSADGKAADSLWRNENYQNLMGGIILLDGTIYGSAYRSSKWFSIDTKSGKEKIISEELGNGVILYADGLFYCYSEKGEVALVDMTPDSFTIKGKFEVPLGTDQHWAHPLIYNKRLYLRHGNALMVYDIAAK